MRALWILLAVVGVFGLMLLLPICLYIEYLDEEMFVRLGIGPIRVRLLPPKKRHKAKKEKRELPECAASAKKKRTIQSIYAEAKRYIPLVKTVLSMIPDTLHAAVIDKLTVYVKLCDDDPADLALHYGQAWAAIGWIVTTISNTCRLKQQDVRPVMDTRVNGFALEAAVKVHLTGWRVCGLGVKFLKRYLQRRKSAAENKGV